ncbi:cytochrome c3 family protein [Mangrovibacterium lignilyticum]|uniref:cytochrome c3 family protein n=1 Tax=Mangrovibacterium lignilyticum TaxID=2668052 RepID=UPI0013D16475|nr:cytochrome c3 family protein [Mangrovibacterium lignilyticum]
MRILLIILLATCLGSLTQAKAQYYDDPKEHQCLKCHSNTSYSFHNELMDREEKRMMNPYYVLDTVAMRTGVHQVFDCTDCHSYEYSTYPHQANLKLEPLATCLDCHGGDETFASYQFERIDEEVQKSVHFDAYGESFNCSKCHDQHTYRPIARTAENVKEIVDYSNKMCLTCHANMQRYEMVAGREKPELVQVHRWLPNQQLHFENVRCIECHTDVTDSLMVSHNIRPKTQAVRNCIECHSGNSKLKASLYKYENLQKRSEGVLGNIISNDSYVIGTHQVPFLQWLSVVILICVLGGVLVHVIFRILKK